jgi:hypothetical protein
VCRGLAVEPTGPRKRLSGVRLLVWSSSCFLHFVDNASGGICFEIAPCSYWHYWHVRFRFQIQIYITNTKHRAGSCWFLATRYSRVISRGAEDFFESDGYLADADGH